MEDLLIKYIVGEADKQEQQELEDWMAADPENRKAYERIRTIWENSKMPGATAAPDVHAAWERFKVKRAAAEEMPVVNMTVRKGGQWKRVSMAAAAVLIVLSGFLLYWNTPVKYETLAQSEIVKLPDHSVITLNNNSTLSYSRSFNKKERVVHLEGEGFFDVARNPEKPFLIHVADVDVMVLGTSFNIRSTRSLTEVSVETGIVKVTKGKESYTLRPDEKLVISKTGKQARVGKIENKLYQYYRTNVFVCDSTPLPELIECLSNAYGVNIKVENPLLTRQHLTSKYPKTDSVQNILEKVALTLSARLEKQGATYVFK